MTSAIAIATSLLAGALLLVLGVRRLVTHMPRAVSASRAGAGVVSSLIPAATALRLALGGVALVVLALGWLAEVSWAGDFAVVFGLEELYETSMVVGCLRWAERSSAAGPAPLTATPGRAFEARARTGAWRTAEWV